MTTLNDKVGIITGASSGIGDGVARELRDAGMKLVLTSRRVEALHKLAAELGEEHCAVLAGDMIESEMPQKLIDAAEQKFGRLDFVFNNAGVMHVGGIEDIDIDTICDMVRVNVEAPYRLAYTALRRLVAQGSGDLINTSSILGTKVRATTEAYAGTKHAIEALTEGLRMQLAGTGVRVCALEPGLIETHLQDHFPTHPRDALDIKKLATPADIGRTVRFILEQPDHVTIPRILVQPSEQAM